MEPKSDERMGRAPKTSQEVIDLLKVEILRLKIENNRLRAKLNLAADGNEQLTVERGCQTNLDLMNMEELMRSNWTLKRKMLDGSGFQVHSKPRSMDHLCHLTQSAAPAATTASTLPPALAVPTKLKSQHPQPNMQLAPDEKQLLEQLFRIDGELTITHDKLVAKLGTRY